MIEATDVRVDYDDVTAVRDLNLHIPAGQVFGLIGPNGAGKTSAIRVLATLLRPTYGDVRIGGVDIEADPGAVHRIIGYMPDLPPVYPDLRCHEFLMLFAGTYFIERRERRHRVDECLEIVDLAGKRDAMAGTLSRGMTQRLILAKTLLPEPRVLLLDEPASGLDPIARIELREILRELGRAGCSVLVSSHILTELSDMADAVGIMEKGEMRLSGRIDDIIEQMRGHRRIVLDLVRTPHDVLDRLGAGATNPERDGNRVTFEFEGSDEDTAALLRKLVLDGFAVKGFHEEKMDLEDIVRQVAREVS